MTYANVNGIEMYYEVHGTGRPVVLLHGGVLTAELTFGEMMPALAATRQVIAVELQGHGHTADTDREMRLDLLADDVVALLDQLGVERADLFGFSLGGLVATQVAIGHPERVDRLVLVSTHYRTAGYHPEIRDPEQWATSTRMPTQEDFKAMADAYARVAPDPSHFPAFMAKVSAVPDTVDRWTVEEIRSIGAPTLLVIGDHDFVRIEHAADLLALLPHARLAVLPDTTHVGTMSHPTLLPLAEAFLTPERLGEGQPGRS